MIHLQIDLNDVETRAGEALDIAMVALREAGFEPFRGRAKVGTLRGNATQIDQREEEGATPPA